MKITKKMKNSQKRFDKGRSIADNTIMKNDKPRLMPLTQNQWAIVDADMYETLNQRKWRAQQDASGYHAVRQIRQGKKRILVSMAALIIGKKSGHEIDHINGNPLDNRRCNLRHVEHRQNQRRRLRNKRMFSSRYKGVAKTYRRLKDGKQTWVANIYTKGKHHYFGVFDDEIEAAKAYDRKALEYFGEYARINFPENSNVPLTPGDTTVENE